MKVFSIIETVKANELKPQKYLEFLLDNYRSDEMTDEELDKFAPWSEKARLACSN